MLPVTSLAASLAAVSLVALSVMVSLRRRQVGLSIGIGEDRTLHRRIRAQGNFIEYVPMALLLLALAERAQVPGALLWAIAGLLGFGRLSHAVGMLRGAMPLHAAGMLATYGALLLGAAVLVL